MNLQLFAEETEETRKAALYDAFAPSLETLAKKYGIEADPAALETALTQEAEAEQHTFRPIGFHVEFFHVALLYFFRLKL